MRRFRTTFMYVEGRASPERPRFSLASQPRLVLLAILIPAFALVALVLASKSVMIPVLLGLIAWIVVSVYASYVVSDYLFGSVDRLTLDLQSPEVRFRSKWPADRVLLLWSAVTSLVTGVLVVITGLSLQNALAPVPNAVYLLSPIAWAIVGVIICLLGIGLFGVFLIVVRVVGGIGLSPTGISFRRGVAEERRGWGEVRRVSWSGGHGRLAKLRIDFPEDRPLIRRSFWFASNAELVARLIEFYRANPERREALVDIDRALDTFEIHH